MFDDHRARAAASSNDIYNASRQSRLGDNFREQQRREPCVRSRLQHHRVAHRNRGRDLPCQHQQREVPRDDLPDHTDRLIVAQFGFHQLRPTRIIVKVTRQQRHINIARFTDRLAVVHAFEHRQQTRMFLNIARNRVEITSASHARSFAPSFECTTSRCNRCVYIFFLGLSGLGKQLAIRRVVRRIELRSLRRHPLVIDEQAKLASMLIQPRLNSIRRFGRRSVFHGVENFKYFAHF